jgi:hypothetical protein
MVRPESCLGVFSSSDFRSMFVTQFLLVIVCLIGRFLVIVLLVIARVITH